MSISHPSRRLFLSLAAGAWASPSFLSANSTSTRRRFSATFSTSSDEAAQLLPTGLAVAAEARFRLDVEIVEPTQADILEPKPWEWACLSLAATAGDSEGWTPLRIYVSNERALRIFRERDGLPAMPAEVSLSVEGDRLQSSIRAAGEEPLEISATIEAESGRPSSLWPMLVWTGQPSADWQGPGGELNGASIAKLESVDEPIEGRTCSGIKSSWPLGEPASAWYGDSGSPAAPQRTLLSSVAAAEAAPWSPLSYPKGSNVLAPSRLEPDALTKLADRKEIQLGPLEACEIDLMVSQEAHEAMLPPMCRSGGRPMLKLLGLRVHRSELSPEPFQEVWLFAFAIVAGRAGWFAVSHITEPQGDAVHGREAFGYPTKLGSPDIVATPLDFQLTVNRLGREVAYARGMFKGFATGTSLGQLPMMSLRAKRGGESAEILFQPWTFQGRRSRVDPATLEVSFPGAKAKGMDLLSDPWSELNPLRPLAVSAMDGAAMQRGPAEVLLEWDDFGAFYRERCDGVLPWETEPAKLPQPSLLVSGPAAGPRT
jgi:hypothetical protein